MKWYGYTSYSVKNFFYNKCRNFQKKQNKAALILNGSTNLNFFKINIYIPAMWNILFFKKTNNPCVVVCYMYSCQYFFCLPLITAFLSLKYDSQVNCLSLQFFYKNNFFVLFWIYFRHVLNSFSKIFFKKLKFKGKGYYIYKNARNTIALQFGYSHKLYLYSFFVPLKFVTKTIILMFGINYWNILNRGYALFNLKPINVFTGRGIRFARQIVYRKVGKISSYR